MGHRILGELKIYFSGFIIIVNMRNKSKTGLATGSKVYYSIDKAVWNIIEVDSYPTPQSPNYISNTIPPK